MIRINVNGKIVKVSLDLWDGHNWTHVDFKERQNGLCEHLTDEDGAYIFSEDEFTTLKSWGYSEVEDVNNGIESDTLGILTEDEIKAGYRWDISFDEA